MPLTQFQQNNSAVIYTDLNCYDTQNQYTPVNTSYHDDKFKETQTGIIVFGCVCVHLGAIRTGAFILIYNQREDVTELLALKETLTQSR